YNPETFSKSSFITPSTSEQKRTFWTAPRHAPAHRFYKHSVPTGRWSHDLSIRVACEYLVPILFTPIGDQRKDLVPEGPNVCSRTAKVITRPVGTECLTRHGYFNFTPNDVSTKSKNQKSII